MRRILLISFLLCWVWAAVAQPSSGNAAPAAQATTSTPQAAAQTTEQSYTQGLPTHWIEAPDERSFLPKGNWIYGYVEWDFAPPHNEPDPNLCAANSGNFGGKNATCNAFARYLIPSEIYVRPFGKTALRRIKVFYDGTFIFGKNVPQYLYTWSWDGIGWEHAWGGDFYIGKRFDFRLTQHFLITNFRSSPLGPGYLGPNGPWGRYFTIGVRKYFGNPKVLDEGAK
jgi:hypothetical protein